MSAESPLNMEVLLLSDITGIGRKNDLIVVASGFALNCLLPERKAIVVTPSVRKRYAEQIKNRAMEREKERELQQSMATALAGKVVKIEASAGKAGKLYASVSRDMIVDALRMQHGIDVPASSITIQDPIKSVGDHRATLTIGAQNTAITLQVQSEKGKKRQQG